MSKVSIIMPTYNRRDVINRAIDSVLSQSFKDYELIIIDDGSDDGTKDSLASLLKRNSQLKYLEFEENKGQSAARNFGIKKSTSDYLAFLDTDNTWHEDFLKVMISFLETNKKILMAYSSQNLFLVSQKGKILKRKVRSIEYNPIKLLKGNFIDTNATVVRRSLVKKVGLFDESLTAFEDWDLFVRIATKFPYRIEHIDQVLGDYYYSENFETVSNKNYPKNAIRSYMGFPTSDKLTKKVLANIKKYQSQK